MDSMSISELKHALDIRGIDYRDCVEKKDLLARLQQDVQDEDAMGELAQSRVDELTDSERRMVELFERCSPSVAYIQTTQISQSRQQLSLNATQEVPAGTGSGFVWDAEGHVVTNFHVIKEAINKGRAKVTLNRGTEAFDATLVGADPDNDLAVLKVAAPRDELSPIAIGNSADLRVGQAVVAIGNPFGLDHTLTTGVVSALGREVMGVGGRPINGCIQTDASINPGNSGGPLLDSSGRLIGVNTAIFSPSGASVGIGFSIPVDTVRRIVNQIVRYGFVLRPSLGAQIADDQIVRNLARQLKLGNKLQGVLVMTVGADSPAAKGGMRGTVRDGRSGGLILGDVITAVAGEPTRQVEELLSVVENRRVGEAVEVTVLRGVGASAQHPGGKEVTLRIQLVERQQLPDSSSAPNSPQRVRSSRPRL